MRGRHRISSAAAAASAPERPRASDDLGAEQIVHVEGTDELSGFCRNKQLIDLVALHQLDRLGGELVRGDRARVAGHDLVDLERADIGFALQSAAQIPVGGYSDDLSAGV